jgi:hypothetical protein
MRGTENNYPISDFMVVNNSNFRYTVNPERREWVKLFYPYIMKYFFDIVKAIPWESYTYEGETYAKEWYEGNREDKYRDVGLIPVSVKGIHYKVFGGAVCEFLNMKYEAETGIHLRDYVDPTGDFDIQIFYDDKSLSYGPPMEESNADIYRENHNIIAFSLDEQRVSPFIDHLTKWVYDHVCEKISALPIHSRKSGESLSSVRLNDNKIVSHLHIDFEDPLFLYTRFGDLLVIRKKEGRIIKIQVAAAIRLSNGTEIVEHLAEFVFARTEGPGNEGEINREEKMNVMTIDGIKIESIGHYFSSQINGYFGRYSLFTSESDALFYKQKNHIERMKYILAMVPFLDKKFPRDGSTERTIRDSIHYSLTINLPYFLREAGERTNRIRVNRTGNNSKNYVPLQYFISDFMDYYNRPRRRRGGRRHTRKERRRLSKKRVPLRTHKKTRKLIK